MNRLALSTLGLALAAIALSLPVPLAGQEVDSATVEAPPAPPPDTAVWIAVAPRPRSTVVATTVTFPVGSGDDPNGLGGTAWLVGRTLEAMAQEALGEGAAAAVEVLRGQLHATLLAPPSSWESDFQTFATVLMRRELAADRFEAERAGLLSRLTFEAGAPVREFEVEAARLYASGEQDWARPPEGDLESLPAVTLDDLAQFRRRHLNADDVAVAVVGPVDPEAAVGVTSTIRDRSSSSSASSRRDAGAGVAWATGDRLALPRDITNTSLAVAYPLPAGHDRTTAEFLAHVLQEKLNPVPPDPGVYRAEVQVVDAPTGALLVIEAAVFPEVGDRWERQIATAVQETAGGDPYEDVYFPWQQRRFRSAAMQRDATPEGLSRRLASDLLRGGATRDVDADIRTLTAEGLVTLATTLGQPRVLFFGPDLGADQEQ
jgi:hypothetical protein